MARRVDARSSVFRPTFVIDDRNNTVSSARQMPVSGFASWIFLSINSDTFELSPHYISSFSASSYSHHHGRALMCLCVCSIRQKLFQQICKVRCGTSERLPPHHHRCLLPRIRQRPRSLLPQAPRKYHTTTRMPDHRRVDPLDPTRFRLLLVARHSVRSPAFSEVAICDINRLSYRQLLRWYVFHIDII